MTELQKRHIEIFNQLPEAGRKLIQRFTPDFMNWYDVEDGEIVSVTTSIKDQTRGTAINQVLLDLKAAGIWAKMYSLH
jgi:hypothetical protein